MDVYLGNGQAVGCDADLLDAGHGSVAVVDHSAARAGSGGTGRSGSVGRSGSNVRSWSNGGGRSNGRSRSRDGVAVSDSSGVNVHDLFGKIIENLK